MTVPTLAQVICIVGQSGDRNTLLFCAAIVSGETQDNVAWILRNAVDCGWGGILNREGMAIFCDRGAGLRAGIRQVLDKAQVTVTRLTEAS